MEARTDPGRLLALTAVPPWPCHDGYSVRAGHLLEELSRQWDVTVLSPGNPEANGDAPGAIEWIPLPDVPATNILPWREERERLVEATRSQLASADFDGAVLWNGTEYVAEEIPGFPPAVGDRIDCETLQAWRSRKHRWWGFRRKLQELRRGVDMARYERRTLPCLEAVAVTTPTDRRALALVTGHDRVVVVSNGVSLPDLSAYPGERPVPTVIFTGVLGFPPNVEAVRHFLLEVWPAVLRQVPDAEFVVAGRSPVPEAIASLADRPGVVVRPDVPDMTEELRRAWVAVAPMRTGGGIKNKVLEAWAAARPVVLTELAASGLTLEEPSTDLVTSSPAGMARTLAELLSSESARRDHGRAGRRLVQRHHTWRQAARPLHVLLSDILASSGERMDARAHRDPLGQDV